MFASIRRQPAGGLPRCRQQRTTGSQTPTAGWTFRKLNSLPRTTRSAARTAPSARARERVPVWGGAADGSLRGAAEAASAPGDGGSTVASSGWTVQGNPRPLSGPGPRAGRWRECAAYEHKRATLSLRRRRSATVARICCMRTQARHAPAATPAAPEGTPQASRSPTPSSMLFASADADARGGRTRAPGARVARWLSQHDACKNSIDEGCEGLCLVVLCGGGSNDRRWVTVIRHTRGGLGVRALGRVVHVWRE